MRHVPLDIAAAIAEVKPATIRKWVERGIVRRFADGYDPAELLHWIDTRNRNMAELATTPRRVACVNDLPVSR